MPNQDIVVIGGSAGGLEALTTVLSTLPSSFDASLFVVLHTSPQSGGGLPQVLERSCLLPVAFAGDSRTLSSASTDGTARVWDLPRAKTSVTARR